MSFLPGHHINDGPNLSVCDREPIHVPGSVEPNGVLLAFREQELTVAQVSASAAVHIGMEAEALLGTPLGELFDGDSVVALRQQILSGNLHQKQRFLSGIRIRNCQGSFNASLHTHQGVLIIELEPTTDPTGVAPAAIFSSVTDTLADLEGRFSLVELCKRVVINVRQLTGFDRVMVYRFLEDNSGVVIAEERRGDLVPYLGLRYPASDIPAQARRLYLVNALRLKADVNALRSPMIPPLNPDTGQPLDMTHCVLRAMSPVHDEYLRNMGVTASMSVSIVKNERLWGLIACHHTSAKTVPYQVRLSCEILARVFSAHIATAEEEETRRGAASLRESADRLAERLRAAIHVKSALVEEGVQLAGAIGAGVAICVGGEISLVGDVPSLEQVEKIQQWLDKSQHEYIFHTDKLSERYPADEGSSIDATGLLSIRIALGARDFILWFRPPVEKIVEWAGNPAEPVKETEAGRRISPRLSFERWRESVGDRSEPWREYEREFALGVRNIVAELLLVQQNTQVTRLNLELERSNIELDAFAYAASHDLQEPIRTLRAYSQLLARRAATRLTIEEVELLKMVESAAARMSNLISALLDFAQVGGSARRDAKPISLEDVLRATLLNLAESIRDSGAEVTNDPLPTVTADQEHIMRLLQNLIGNSIRYRRPEVSLQVYISAVREEEMWRFGVHDNGEGFEKEQSEFIFEAFKRLHGRNNPGTGIGLATCRRIVEQHGGRIWAESEGSGRGATFWFTLPAAV